MSEKISGITEETVMAALSTVIEPELHRDLVSLNMIRDLQIDGNDISFTIMLTTPACPLKGKMEGDSRAALAQVPGLGDVTINWGSNVPLITALAARLGSSSVIPSPFPAVKAASAKAPSPLI